MKIFIHDGEVITSEGNLEATWTALGQGKTPPLYQPKGHNLRIPLALISELNEELGTAQRLQALLDKLFLTLPHIAAETALICATTKGAIDEIFTGPDPAGGQVWQIAESIRTRLNLDKEADCISAACASGTIAVIQGAMKIATGECDSALIIGIDLISNFVLSGFASLKALSPAYCRPFDQDRDGLILGEGAGWLLLSRYQRPFSSTARTFFLSRWGISCDATHITAPCRKAGGLIRALKQTVSGRSSQPGGICAHGTGTVYNDAMELLAFNSLWLSPPPVCSVKGTIGHCLGAAGIIESCLSLKSLQTGYLPPTVGLCHPEDNGRSILSGTDMLQLHNQSILSCNSGFGGINAAVLFEEEFA